MKPGPEEEVHVGSVSDTDFGGSVPGHVGTRVLENGGNVVGSMGKVLGNEGVRVEVVTIFFGVLLRRRLGANKIKAESNVPLGMKIRLCA